MRKISLLTAVAVLILVGIGARATSTTPPRVDIPTEVGIDPSQMMLNRTDLPTEHHVDYSFVFI
jgi:hypothetical protein